MFGLKKQITNKHNKKKCTVSSWLYRVNLPPLDSDKEKLMRENLALRKYKSLYEKSKTNVCEELTCGICRENPVNCVINCGEGHSFCQKCVESFRPKECPYCRKKFTQHTKFLNPFSEFIKKQNDE